MLKTSIEHKDFLYSLNNKLTLKDKLVCTHEAIKQFFPFLSSVAITIYDPATTLLKTYVDSSDQATSRHHRQAHLMDVPSLKDVFDTGQPSVINNLQAFEQKEHDSIKLIGREGYAVSYTIPFFDKGVFLGFTFFNTNRADSLTENVLHELDVFGHIISLLVINEMESMRTLTAAVKTTERFTHARDMETGCHLDRMSRYSRLIAVYLADKYDLDDAYIEHIFRFSTLHDIGKVGIPDSILLKPGKLTKEETETMHTHACRGREIIDNLISDFGFEHFEYVNVLRNIVEHHHEVLNGTGYPKGISGTQIPLEARIVSVADIFDALTSRRSYKDAWSNEEAFELLKKMSEERLDKDCVEAIVKNREEVEAIQQQFNEDKFG
jgi:HD-GYP domain-containing protein (c-di-GMP phosphodiesterase class II)